MTLLFKCPKCGARRQREGFYIRTQHCICGWGVAEASAAWGGEQQPTGGGTSAPNPPCTPPSPCEMCNGVGFYVSLPGDVISPCPYCSEKHSTRLTADAVDSGSNDSTPIDGDGERS